MKKITLKFMNGSVSKFLSQKTFLISIVVVLTSLLINTGAVQQNEYELSNDKISLTINNQGHLVKLQNRITGHNYITTPDHELWRRSDRKCGTGQFVASAKS